MTTTIATATAFARKIQEVKALSIWELADLAGVSVTGDLTPDGFGAEMLEQVRRSVISEFDAYTGVSEEYDLAEIAEIDAVERAIEIGDGAPSVYTARAWQAFADLHAWEIEIGELGAYETAAEREDSTAICTTALYQIAERLAETLLNQLIEAAADTVEAAEDGE